VKILSVKARGFSGGYRFERFEGQPKNELISPPISPRVLIPLAQGFGVGHQPLVKKGDAVRAGQIIARNDSTVSSPIHSSVSGKVVDVRKMNYFKREIFMAEISSSGSQEHEVLDGHTSQWERLSPSKIEELIYTSGVSSLDREGIPTRFKSSIIMPEQAEHLIIHGVESEAYNISLDLLFKGKNLFKFVEGIKMLRKIMPNAKIHLAINRERRPILESLKKLTSGMDNLAIYPLSPRYPLGYDEVIVPTLLAKRFPYGYSAASIGIVVLNIQAILHVYEAVAEGKPLIERIIALCGPAFKENIHLKVRTGTPLEFLLKERIGGDDSRVVLNSLLTGVELNDKRLPIDRTFSQLIAIPENRTRQFLSFIRPGLRSDSYSRSFVSCLLKNKKSVSGNQHGERRPCIQCGYCLEVCPVSIIPAYLNRRITLGINETLMQYGIFNCIDCNLCSYVCPSKIPIAKNIRNAKTALIESGCDHSLCILPKFSLKGLEEYKGVKTLR